MAITSGEDILASDFIDQGEKDGTPANDEGRVPKLESDAKVHQDFIRGPNRITLNAGATINGATLPVPVYQDTSDNEVYACDANDSTKYKFIGFAVTNGTDGNAIEVTIGGVVGGFSSLDEGTAYYVQDTVGTIGSTPGTQSILVGIAISATEIFIQKGGRVASGSASITGTNTSSITVGFRPTLVLIETVGGSSATSHGSWSSNGGNNCTYDWEEGGSNTAQGTGSASQAWHNVHAFSGGAETENHNGVVDTITATGFRLNQTKSGGSDAGITIKWVAFGDF